MHSPRCASPIAAAGPRLGLGSAVGLESLGSCFGGGLALGGRREMLPELRAFCQRLHFTDVSLWLFNRGQADPAGRETAAGSGSPSIPQGLAGQSRRVQDGCRQQGGGRTRGCLGGTDMELEEQISAPGSDEPTGTG